MQGYASGSGCGRVGRGDSPNDRRLRVYGMRAAAASSPAAARVLRAVPNALGVELVRAGLSPDLLRQHAGYKGAPNAGSMSIAECVGYCGLPLLAGACGLTVADLLQRAGVRRDLAEAAGVVPMRRASVCATGGTCGGTCGGGCGAHARGYGSLDNEMPEKPPKKDPDVEPGVDDDDNKKPPPVMGGDGFPASPPYRPGNWDLDGERYMIAPGDTLSGLARLYLGGPQRWKEIWAPNKGRFTSPDKIPANTWIVMPPEAVSSARSMVKDKTVPKSPASPGAPGSVPGKPDPGDPHKPGVSTGLGGWGYVVAGVLGVTLVGGVVYAATT